MNKPLHYCVRLAIRSAIVLLGLVGAARVEAGTGTSDGLAQSTFINQAAPGNNMGGCGYRVVGVTTGLQNLYTLVQYPISQTGKNAGRISVTGVNYSVTPVSGMPGSGSGSVLPIGFSVSRIGNSWQPGSKCKAMTTSPPAQGQTCTGGEATWNSPDCSATTWNGGGLSGGAHSNGTSGSAMTWSGCPGTICSDVQAWINSPSANNGWAIIGDWSGVTTAGHHGAQISAAGSFSYSYSCLAGYKEVAAGSNPTTNCTTCTDAANTACVTSAGNVCNDPGPPSTTYSCTCSASGWKAGSGNTSCVPACTSTTCKDQGDSAAVCTNTATGYTCSCGSGYISNGTTCVAGCNNASPTPMPCGNGGTCNTTDGGNTWTCSCPAGYVTTGGSRPSCVRYHVCQTAAAQSDCVVAQINNTCVENPAPAITYTCQCNNPAYQLGTGTDGNPACVGRDFCQPNHCLDGGDPFATCTSAIAPNVGYTCSCGSKLWTGGTVGGNASCVDLDECAGAINPCLNGTCTNIANGGGYSCACNPGFTSTGGSTPQCVHDFCATSGNLACVTAKPGNTCINGNAGYTCVCDNPGYIVANRRQECIPATSCSVNHCLTGGDANALCSDLAPPAIGFRCACDAGFTFDGTTCTDVNECLNGGNPCGHGGCNNTLGGYSCTCEPGYASTGGATPTCKASVGANGVTYTVDAGSGCDYAGGRRANRAAAALALLCLGLAFAWRRSRRRG